MADSIKVVVLENDFAALCRLGLPVSLSVQLQQSGLKLADALWTVRSSRSGFSVSLFWPSDIRTSNRHTNSQIFRESHEIVLPLTVSLISP